MFWIWTYASLVRSSKPRDTILPMHEINADIRNIVLQDVENPITTILARDTETPIGYIDS